jgi:hypothetical protein
MLRVVTTVTVVSNVPYPDAYEGMTLEQAVEYEQNVDDEDRWTMVSELAADAAAGFSQSTTVDVIDEDNLPQDSSLGEAVRLREPHHDGVISPEPSTFPDNSSLGVENDKGVELDSEGHLVESSTVMSSGGYAGYATNVLNQQSSGPRDNFLQ